MTISFDLDDLLINGIKRFDVEKLNLWQRMLTSERLRLGTIELFKSLRSQGHHLYIYTTSLRSPFRIRLLFWAHGLRVDKIFNKTAHDEKIKGLNIPCSKYPPMFGIDLHIDDSVGARIEGQKFGFKVLIIEENDLNWTETIFDKVNRHPYGTVA